MGAGLVWLCTFAVFVFVCYVFFSRSLWRGCCWNSASVCRWWLSNLSASCLWGFKCWRQTLEWSRIDGSFCLVLLSVRGWFCSIPGPNLHSLFCEVQKTIQFWGGSNVLWESEVPQQSHWGNCSCLEGKKNFIPVPACNSPSSRGLTAETVKSVQSFRGHFCLDHSTSQSGACHKNSGLNYQSNRTIYLQILLRYLNFCPGLEVEALKPG